MKICDCDAIRRGAVFAPLPELGCDVSTRIGPHPQNCESCINSIALSQFWERGRAIRVIHNKEQI
jgi:hypothetical protein